MPVKRKRGASNVGNVQPRVIVSSTDGADHAASDDARNPGNMSPSSRSSSLSQSYERQSPKSIPATDNVEASMVQKAEIVSVNGGREEPRMEEPPRAGLCDPAGGYKTNSPPKDRIVRVYADGVFDLFHLGHMRQLEQAKNAFPRTHLTVGVTGNEQTHRRKGLTVLSAKERAESLRHCRWVDAVLEDCPWVVTDAFLEEHKFDYVAHDDLPYGAAEGDDIYAPIKASGKFLVTQRTEGVSTTGIITKIIRDYNNYVGRQLKRGTSRQELNVSWLKKNELDLKRHVGELRDAVRSNWSNTGQELGREINRLLWSDRSRPASPAPSAISTPAKESGGPGNLAQQTLANRLEAPRSPMNGSPVPSARGARNHDFATGYTLGLVGGIRSWMTRNRRNVGEGDASILDSGSGASSSDEEATRAEDESDEPDRGRRGKRVKVA